MNHITDLPLNQHRREALTNNINTLEQDYLNMNDNIDHARGKLNVSVTVAFREPYNHARISAAV